MLFVPLLNSPGIEFIPLVSSFLPISCAKGLFATAFITSVKPFPPCLLPLRHAAPLIAAAGFALALLFCDLLPPVGLRPRAG